MALATNKVQLLGLDWIDIGASAGFRDSVANTITVTIKQGPRDSATTDTGYDGTVNLTAETDLGDSVLLSPETITLTSGTGSASITPTGDFDWNLVASVTVTAILAVTENEDKDVTDRFYYPKGQETFDAEAYYLSWEWEPSVVVRAQDFPVSLVVRTSLDDSIVTGYSGTATLALSSPDGSDALSDTDITITAGVGSVANQQITGGTGTDSGVTITASIAADTSVESAVTSAFYVTSTAEFAMGASILVAYGTDAMSGEETWADMIGNTYSALESASFTSDADAYTMVDIRQSIAAAPPIAGQAATSTMRRTLIVVSDISAWKTTLVGLSGRLKFQSKVGETGTSSATSWDSSYVSDKHLYLKYMGDISSTAGLTGSDVRAATTADIIPLGGLASGTGQTYVNISISSSVVDMIKAQTSNMLVFGLMLSEDQSTPPESEPTVGSSEYAPLLFIRFASSGQLALSPVTA